MLQQPCHLGPVCSLPCPSWTLAAIWLCTHVVGALTRHGVACNITVAKPACHSNCCKTGRGA